MRRSPEQITTNDIRVYLYKYQEQRHITNRSLDKIRQCVNGFYEWLVDNGYQAANPCKQVLKIKYEEKPRQFLTQIELEYMRRACRTKRETAIVEMLYSTGARVSELVGIKLSDIDFSDKSVRIFGKGNKHRVSFLNAKAEVALKEYLAERKDNTDALIVSQRRPYRGLGKQSIEHIIRVMSVRAQEVSKHVTPHVVRHTMATTAHQNGMPIESIQTLLGHASLDTTMIYTHTDMSAVQGQHLTCVI